jgi:hypothetical protein
MFIIIIIIIINIIIMRPGIGSEFMLLASGDRLSFSFHRWIGSGRFCFAPEELMS